MFCFATLVLTLIVLRYFNLFVIRLYPNLYSKHSGINENCDFLVLIDNQIHYFALRRQIEPQAMYYMPTTINILLHTPEHPADLTVHILHPFLMSFIPSIKMTHISSYLLDETSEIPFFYVHVSKGSIRQDKGFICQL